MPSVFFITVTHGSDNSTFCSFSITSLFSDKCWETLQLYKKLKISNYTAETPQSIINSNGSTLILDSTNFWQKKIGLSLKNLVKF